MSTCTHWGGGGGNEQKYQQKNTAGTLGGKLSGVKLICILSRIQLRVYLWFPSHCHKIQTVKHCEHHSSGEQTSAVSDWGSKDRTAAGDCKFSQFIPSTSMSSPEIHTCTCLHKRNTFAKRKAEDMKVVMHRRNSSWRGPVPSLYITQVSLIPIAFFI